MSRTWNMLHEAEWQTRNPTLTAIASESAHIDGDAEAIAHDEPRSVLADRLRFLRTQLRGLWKADKLKSLLITSPFPHEGKSTVALNLAIVLAEEGERNVLLVEGDLHHPTLTKRMGLDGRLTMGLADCLEENTEPFSAIRRIDPIGLYLLPAGKSRKHPTELLQRDALSSVMLAVREHFDWVLIDSPPVKPLSDTLLLRQQADATLLVVRAGLTPSPAVDEAVVLLGKQHILGMILNGVEGLERTYSRYYGSYSGRSQSK